MARRTTTPTVELGVRLEKERELRGLTMQGMADYLGVSKPTYLGWLRGTQPQPHHMRLIAKKLNTKTSTVLAWVLVSGLYITWKDGVPVLVPASADSSFEPLQPIPLLAA